MNPTERARRAWKQQRRARLYVQGTRHWTIPITSDSESEQRMTTFLSVTPGVDMTRALGEQRLTKEWLRDYLRDHPEKDFRNLSPVGGTYVNGGDALRMDLTLEVHRKGSCIAIVNYQATDSNQWGYQAVVR